VSNPILIIIAISLVIGILCGAVIVWFIYLGRRNQVVDSLVRTDNIIGRIGVVEIPFSHNSQGKVRINLKGSMVYLQAFTDEEKEFHIGEKVLIMGLKGNKVWVVSDIND
jgi:membrane protein implicated in regulation of membrane protease activity